MKRRDDAGDDIPQAQEFTVPYDTVTEVVVIAAAIAANPEQRRLLLSKLNPDMFLVEEHRATWVALKEMERKELAFSFDTIHRVSSGRVKAEFLQTLRDARPWYPENIEYHLETLAWDRRRVAVARGSASAFFAALKDPYAEPMKVKALANAVAESFAGHVVKEHLYDPKVLVGEMMAEVNKRFGEAADGYPYGIPTLDCYENGERRIVLGTEPGQLTVVTGVPGSCKSTTLAHMALGIARQRRRVLYGAWEVESPMTLLMLAVISLGWIMGDILDPKGAVKRGNELPPEMLRILEERAHQISEWVRFMKNPFRDRRVREARLKLRRDDRNDFNLDIVESAVSDSGCDVFIADLWKRCLATKTPDDEEEALFRQQAMLQELSVHGILAHQQRSKDVELREDKRPTREGMKGSGAYTEAAYNIIAPHRPALWTKTPDVTLELFILKQKLGPWPLGVEFDWDGTRLWFGNGRSIDYDPPGTQGVNINSATDVGTNFNTKKRPWGAR
jgi:replicative DNA helicase